MRHKGAAHLRSESYKLPWYAYHCLDVMAVSPCSIWFADHYLRLGFLFMSNYVFVEDKEVQA